MSGEKLVFDKKVKVAICSPVMDDVKAAFADCLARMMVYTAVNYPNVEMTRLRCHGSLIPKQREHLAIAAVDRDFTHILWLDGDMEFPVDTLVRLLAREQPAVCASYTERAEPYRPVAFLDIKNFVYRAWPKPEYTGLKKIAACGMGCMLIHTDVYRAMERPYFGIAYMKHTGGFVGEDIFFCMKMAKVTDLMLDQDLTKEIKHHGNHAFTAHESIGFGTDHGLVIEPEDDPIIEIPTMDEPDLTGKVFDETRV